MTLTASLRTTTAAATLSLLLVMAICSASAALDRPRAEFQRAVHSQAVAQEQTAADGLVYVVSKTSRAYKAVPQTRGKTYRGSLKQVLQPTVSFLNRRGGGTVRFTAGTFDFGSQYFYGKGTTNIAFLGAGMRKTLIKNWSNAATDTEPFNFWSADGVTVKYLTVSAGGPRRTTSDALDFDRGNDVLVQRVRVIQSRGRGIVFDGKEADSTALRNHVVGCIITGTASHGIELLASSRNLVARCRIRNVGGSGIVVRKSSPTAAQPDKKSSYNRIRGNLVREAGQEGIIVISGDRNRITGNRVYNSADEIASHDGIRIDEMDRVTCNDNVVEGNIATDTQDVKTQRYGLNISSRFCHRTQVSGNDFSGNLRAPVNDLGTATSFG